MAKHQRGPIQQGVEEARGRTALAGDVTKPMRLNKYIARAGITSRRKADGLIEEGLVKIDGTVVTELGRIWQPGEQVEVNGTLISPQPKTYVLLNKPKDTITTVDDERDRTTVLDLVDRKGTDDLGLFPVGRLDRHTTGALLLTNDGDLAHRLMHPSYEVTKLYRVRTADPVSAQQLQGLLDGVELDDGVAKADRAAYIDPSDRRELGLQLHEGRNRQIRRMLEALGHEVVALDRVQYAGLTTEGIRRGKWRELSATEVQRLRRLVKLK